MEYITEKTIEVSDFLELTQEEFNNLNNLFYAAVAIKYPNYKKYREDHNGGIRKCILIDDYSRIEFLIKVKNDDNNNIES